MPNKVKIGIIICLLLLVAVGIFSWFAKNKEESKFIREKDPQLTTENRKIFEDRLASSEQKLNNAQNDEDKFSWNMQIGYNLQALGKLSEAKRYFKDAIELKPENIVGYTALFQVQVDMTDYESARTSIKKAISLNPVNTDIWRKYILLEKEKFSASNDILNSFYLEALSKTNNSTDITTVYAEHLEASGNLQGALDQWKIATQQYPTNKIYQAEVARLKKALGQK